MAMAKVTYKKLEFAGAWYTVAYAVFLGNVKIGFVKKDEWGAWNLLDNHYNQIEKSLSFRDIKVHAKAYAEAQNA